jgi:hypothetical protein
MVASALVNRLSCRQRHSAARQYDRPAENTASANHSEDPPAEEGDASANAQRRLSFAPNSAENVAHTRQYGTV